MQTNCSAAIFAATRSADARQDEERGQEKSYGVVLNGETQLLVSTTVIEVGVDVPNAVINGYRKRRAVRALSAATSSEGESGVGNINPPVSSSRTPKNDTAQRRMKVMETTTDGFKIADEDLKLRGPGEFFGSRQHGTARR